MEIEIYEDTKIIDLVIALTKAIRDGKTVISIETEIVGDGNNQDGSDEYQWAEAKLICK